MSYDELDNLPCYATMSTSCRSMIIFTKHAKEKFKTLKRHGLSISRSQVEQTLHTSEFIDYSRLHVLRVVYKQEGEAKKVITFYPGRRKQYEKRQ